MAFAIISHDDIIRLIFASLHIYSFCLSIAVWKCAVVSKAVKVKTGCYAVMLSTFQPISAYLIHVLYLWFKDVIAI